MSDLNETIDQLDITNSVSLHGRVSRIDISYVEVEGQSMKGKPKRT